MQPGLVTDVSHTWELERRWRQGNSWSGDTLDYDAKP
jgi:hypothetical protein